MVYGMASFVVLLAAAVLLIVGVALLAHYSGRRRLRARDSDVHCPACQHANARDARFCARCGRELPTSTR
jgi:hypothetical protein